MIRPLVSQVNLENSSYRRGEIFFPLFFFFCSSSHLVRLQDNDLVSIEGLRPNLQLLPDTESSLMIPMLQSAASDSLGLVLDSSNQTLLVRQCLNSVVDSFALWQWSNSQQCGNRVRGSFISLAHAFLFNVCCFYPLGRDQKRERESVTTKNIPTLKLIISDDKPIFFDMIF